jgi:oligopeptide transport system substrate-binding protein
MLSLVLVLGLVLGACGKAENSVVTPEPSGVTPPLSSQRPPVLRILGSDPPTLDPQMATDAGSASYIVEIFSGLVTIDRDLNIVPDIAASWDISNDGKVYTFHLRDDVLFHNGKQATANDFKWSIERACAPETASPVADTYLGDIVGCREKLRGQASEVQGVRAIDDYTLELTIDKPRHYFLAKLTYPTAFVLDKDNVGQDGPNHPWTDDPVGTGPFRLERYAQGEQLVLVRNTYFYGDPQPQLERIEFTISGGSPMILYETDMLDSTPVGLQDLDRVTDPNDPLNAELEIVPELSTGYIALNKDQKPFDDPKVRLAFIMATDREKIVQVVLQGAVQYAPGILPPGLPGYDPNVQGIPYDPERARQLIAESSYGSVDNLPDIVLHVSGGGGAPPAAVEALLEMWRNNLGIEVLLEQTEYSVFLVDVAQRPNPYQLFSMGWIADYPDPQDFLEILFSSKSLDNKVGYNNPEVDRLLDEAAGESDPDIRIELYRQVERLIIEDGVWLTTNHSKSYILTKPWVKGLTNPPMVIERFKYVSIEP